MAITEDSLTPKAIAFQSQTTGEQLTTLYLQQEVMLGILTELQTTLAEFRPMMDKYKTAANANNFLQARRALKHG